MNAKKIENKQLANNKKAFHDFEITETYEAGICLEGTEVKSIKLFQASLKEAYVKIIKNELFLIGCHIPCYSHGNIHNHEERQDRKLLMHAYEIKKLKSLLQEKGLALVPISLYLKRGRIKLKFGLSKGRKKADKRAHIKEKEMKRQAERAMKNS